MRKFIMILLLLLIVGCNGEIYESESNPTIPEMYAIAKGDKYKLIPGNYKFVQKKMFETGVVQTDAAGPLEIAKENDPFEFGKMDFIQFDTTDLPLMTIFLWDVDGNAQEIPLQKNNQLLLPNENGEYIYEIIANWPNSEVSYTFFVEVK